MKVLSASLRHCGKGLRRGACGRKEHVKFWFSWSRMTISRSEGWGEVQGYSTNRAGYPKSCQLNVVQLFIPQPGSMDRICLICFTIPLKTQPSRKLLLNSSLWVRSPTV